MSQPSNMRRNHALIQHVLSCDVHIRTLRDVHIRTLHCIAHPVHGLKCSSIRHPPQNMGHPLSMWPDAPNHGGPQSTKTLLITLDPTNAQTADGEGTRAQHTANFQMMQYLRLVKRRPAVGAS